MNYEGAMRVVCVARLCAKRLPCSELAEGRKIESVTRGPEYGRGWRGGRIKMMMCQKIRTYKRVKL